MCPYTVILPPAPFDFLLRPPVLAIQSDEDDTIINKILATLTRFPAIIQDRGFQQYPSFYYTDRGTPGTTSCLFTLNRSGKAPPWSGARWQQDRPELPAPRIGRCDMLLTRVHSLLAISFGSRARCCAMHGWAVV